MIGTVITIVLAVLVAGGMIAYGFKKTVGTAEPFDPKWARNAAYWGFGIVCFGIIIDLVGWWRVERHTAEVEAARAKAAREAVAREPRIPVDRYEGIETDEDTGYKQPVDLRFVWSTRAEHFVAWEQKPDDRGLCRGWSSAMTKDTTEEREFSCGFIAGNNKTAGTLVCDKSYTASRTTTPTFIGGLADLKKLRGGGRVTMTLTLAPKREYLRRRDIPDEVLSQMR